MTVSRSRRERSNPVGSFARQRTIANSRYSTQSHRLLFVVARAGIAEQSGLQRIPLSCHAEDGYTRRGCCATYQFRHFLFTALTCASEANFLMDRVAIFLGSGRGVGSRCGASTKGPLTSQRLKKAAERIWEEKTRQKKTRSSSESVCQIEVEGRCGGRGCRMVRRRGHGSSSAKMPSRRPKHERHGTCK